ncbi:hypothetical protein TRFO_12239 [Tritrichomonas foetus]|uniref:Macro domain-containing protein n=1 Tax=Tritrichomonas foetus TaxID=1144522 RepID=A0A1J4J5Y7_9EUKA|nr:hypothetical protein TRFO_12239 [Tritrichomonas foetus]|eukprot:OHS92869.1 hypothetical protein TRFO_12239 [Tritrichomonas foetus]
MLNSSFPREEWFKELFGFYETTRDVQKYITVNEDQNGVTFLSSIKNGNKKYQAGKFSLETPSTLRKSNLLKNKSGKQGKFNIVHGSGMNSKKLEYVDIMTSCSSPKFNGATFQVASNFNCLEFSSSLDSQIASLGVTNYAFNVTQGPSAAISTAAGAIYRNYFINHESSSRNIKNEVNNTHFHKSESNHQNNNLNEIGQFGKQINLLQNTPLNVIQGRPRIENKHEIERLKSLHFDWQNLNNYFIGNHQHLEVCLTRGDTPNTYKNVTDKQIVHQVYAAAFNFYDCVIPHNFAFEISRSLLHSEYVSTILAAWKNSNEFPKSEGSHICFLTLLGGGVFLNPPEVVAPAIAMCEEVIAESGLDVNLVCFDDDTFKVYAPLLENTMRRTCGRIITTD